MITLRQLTGTPEEIKALQLIFEDSPRFSILSTGSLAANDAAAKVFTMCPKGKTYEDKLVFGVYEHERLVGCVDLIRAYPGAESAFIGLLLLSESNEGRGLGSLAFREVEKWVAPWGYRQMKLGIIETNERARRFWSKLGFEPTGEAKPFHGAAVETRILVFAKSLPLAA
ncbi:MAG TPA: GNAT family N-acetyltransferase [Ideonella sp.]|uniref:GNAT family N-acetyltransferase n=1 Tax=Ideonella sp. TaxID=1929293 RepID=UPI002CA1D759|nr:GNAT family N-acetyltransferase [Ideonella sp.]HSI52100.1 GNAT family N-acetyltransferase [Ideonella sp.]